VPFRKPEQSGDGLVRDIVNKRADGPGLFQPVALPDLARTHALKSAGLVVQSAGHGTAVDRIDAAVLRDEPHLVAPFFGLPCLGVGGIVVVDQVCVADVLVE